jgi:4-hydroxy-3-methylbut-2-enyl diphosphate reductase
MVRRIRAAHPGADVRFVDTVCQPTRDRLAAARRLAARCAVVVVVVVGGRGSNNTRHLLRACREAGARAHQVETAAEIDPAWFAGADLVGLTAGTSTPDETVEAVRAALLALPPQRGEAKP